MAKNKSIAKVPKPLKGENDSSLLFASIATLIQESKQRVAATVNVELTMLYWNIGSDIHTHILQYQRADYGEQIIATLSHQLSEKYGKGWGVKHLRHCLRIAETFFRTNKLSTHCVDNYLGHTYVP